MVSSECGCVGRVDTALHSGSHTVTVTNYAKNASEPLHKHALNSTLAHRTRTHVKLWSRGVRCVCVLLCFVMLCVVLDLSFTRPFVLASRTFVGEGAVDTKIHIHIYTHKHTLYRSMCSRLHEPCANACLRGSWACGKRISLCVLQRRGAKRPPTPPTARWNDDSRTRAELKKNACARVWRVGDFGEQSAATRRSDTCETRDFGSVRARPRRNAN